MKLGLVVGGGNLPLNIIRENKDIDFYIVMVKGFANADNYKMYKNISVSFGQIGKALSFFKKNDVKNIVFAGAVKQPHYRNILPDWTGFFLLLKLLKLKFFGDNNVLMEVIKYMENKGFNILPADKFLKNKVVKGFIGNIKFKDDYRIDVELGVKILNTLSSFDIGQSIVIQNGKVIGLECVEGTANLIKRCKDLKFAKGRGAILVKMKKETQTDKADLPVIGVDTIRQLKDSEFCGVVIDTNGIIIDFDKTIEEANKNNIFVFGY
ncbi:MAG: UDP-2,3-diacylglucosamine diphosphatase LpxI [Rickettsiales bacterium]|jgi:DUF1009 family protein|nr:UDP-2,3-diacylglucosamine diphosphatase LpxI [Rickettsiales bacterium]